MSLRITPLLSLAVSALAFAQEPAPKASAALQERLDAFVSAGGVPGASVGIVLADGSALAFVAGVSDRESGRALQADDRLLAGSVGKTFVAALALQLVAEGALELDGLVGEQLGSEEWYARLANADTLTLRHLLSHRTGLARYVFEPEFVKKLKSAPDHVWKPEECIAYVLDREPSFAAGVGFAYSDTNYLLVGMMIERTAKGTLYEEVQARLLDPLELEGIVPSDSRVIPRLVQGHVAANDPLGFPPRTLDAEGRFCVNPQFEWAGGGFATTAGDLARWAHALYAGKVLAQEQRDAMLAGEPTPGFGPGVRYGLGAFIWQSARGDIVGHAGFMPGYLTEVRHWVDDGVTVAVQVNTSDGRALPQPLGVLAAELAELARE